MPKTLFICILLSLLPIFIVSTILPDFDSGIEYMLLVGILFVMQSAIMLYYFITSGIKTIDMKCLLFSFIFTISQFITFLISSLTMGINYLEIVNVFARFISVFIFLCIPSKMSISKDEFMRFMQFIVALGLVASLYNMIINFKEMLNILNISNPYEVNFSSFYSNRNSFAQLLFFSIVANTFLYSENKRKINLLYYLIYFINVFLTLSRTVLACVVIFLMVLSYVYNMNRIKASVVVFIFIIGSIVLVTNKPEIRNFIIDMVVRKEHGTSGRSELWFIAINILNEINWIFGVGYMSSMDIIKSMSKDLQEFHSFYIETLVGGGIIDILLHCIIFVVIIRRVKIISRIDRKIGVIYLSAYISLLFYALFESASIFTMGYVGTLFTIFIVTIPLLYSNGFLSKSAT